MLIKTHYPITFMFKKFIVVIFLVSLTIKSGETAPTNIYNIPALKVWTGLWDNPNSTNIAVSVELWSGTNKVITLSPTNCVLLGVTNTISTWSATFPALPFGTNNLTLILTDGVNRSIPSPEVIIVGELAPARNLRP